MRPTRRSCGGRTTGRPGGRLSGPRSNRWLHLGTRPLRVGGRFVGGRPASGLLRSVRKGFSQFVCADSFVKTRRAFSRADNYALVLVNKRARLYTEHIMVSSVLCQIWTTCAGSQSAHYSAEKIRAKNVKEEGGVSSVEGTGDCTNRGSEKYMYRDRTLTAVLLLQPSLSTLDVVASGRRCLTETNHLENN